MNRRLRRQAQRSQGGGGLPAAAQGQQQQLAMLQKVQDELETLTVEGTAGGGAVKVVVTGKQTVQSVEIAPEAAEDVDLLQDLIAAAVNDALGKANEMASERFSSLTGGIDIPGLT
jgi:DNA-binding YbaB/EbfC family protein